jgi:glycosyltransferase involved in cell wall biosynthesis
LATDFWACSRLAADFLFGEQIPKEKIKIMPNAIELVKFQYDEKAREELRNKYKLDHCFVIGHVGRFAISKNHEFLVKMFKEVSEKIEDARLVLIGEGELMQEVTNLVYGLQLEDKVLFLGKRCDVEKWYSAMDMFCLPSKFEGLPISMIEAQASGLYCIGSNRITDEICVTESTELLPLNTECWSQAIQKCRNNHTRYDNMRKLIEDGYEISSQVKRIENEYEKCTLADSL